MNEPYKKETQLLSPSELCSCPSGGCNKSGTQCVAISEAVELTPTALVGTLTTACQGQPVIACKTSADGATCTVTLTQKVCVTIPVSYGVTSDPEDPTIACDDCTCPR
ncbi:MAG: hypothetical protein LKJ80_04920 [Oscillibacter sp.]|jgi:hypothetical protein|nr:hypothetical protein [Oscillibacter sp.]